MAVTRAGAGVVMEVMVGPRIGLLNLGLEAKGEADGLAMVQVAVMGAKRSLRCIQDLIRQGCVVCLCQLCCSVYRGGSLQAGKLVLL